MRWVFFGCVCISVHAAAEASGRQEDGRLLATAARFAPKKKSHKKTTRAATVCTQIRTTCFAGGARTGNPGKEGRRRYGSDRTVRRRKRKISTENHKKCWTMTEWESFSEQRDPWPVLMSRHEPRQSKGTHNSQCSLLAMS